MLKTNQEILLFDTTYLCHRARYSTGGLSYHGEMTGVSFGVLREIEKQIELSGGSALCVFAFDYGGPGKRAEICPGYKASRIKEKTPEEEEEQKSFFEQVRTLGRDLLPAMGFRNIFRRKGFEGDDIIAKICLDLDASQNAVIVSGDHDLWQCLRHNVVFRSPKGEIVTESSFKKQWGVEPEQWATVKALAGCSTDDVIGIKGIGEKKAAAFLAGSLKESSVAYKKILNNIDIVRINLPVVRLPFEGCPDFDLVDDAYSEDKRLAVYERLGIQNRSSRTPSKPKGFNF